jgi:cation transport ATPase
MSTTGKPSNNIMITSIDNIPLKTNGQVITDDMTNDQTVKDVLSEFEKELSLTESSVNNNYKINYQQQQEQQLIQQQQQQQLQQQQLQQQQQSQQKQRQNKKDLCIDNELVVKVFIICIVVALITNPYIYATILSKIPDSLSLIFDNYNYFIKLAIIFVTLYLMMFYNVV